jgi:hypothetical protein
MTNDYRLKKLSNTRTYKSLWLTKAALLVIVIGICVVGKRLTLWPIVAWPMYSTYAPKYPPPTAEIEQLRVVSETDEVYRFLPADLLSFERHKTVQRLIKEAFSDRAKQRQTLTELVAHNLPGVEIKKIERWQLEWQVDPLALPPLERNRPDREIFLGSFNTRSDVRKMVRRE